MIVLDAGKTGASGGGHWLSPAWALLRSQGRRLLRAEHTGLLGWGQSTGARPWAVPLDGLRASPASRFPRLYRGEGPLPGWPMSPDVTEVLGDVNRSRLQYDAHEGG